jgi:hypothetical protein
MTRIRQNNQIIGVETKLGNSRPPAFEILQKIYFPLHNGELPDGLTHCLCGLIMKDILINLINHINQGG